MTVRKKNPKRPSITTSTLDDRVNFPEKPGQNERRIKSSDCQPIQLHQIVTNTSLTYIPFGIGATLKPNGFKITAIILASCGTIKFWIICPPPISFAILVKK